jgi:hypothetical protein
MLIFNGVFLNSLLFSQSKVLSLVLILPYPKQQCLSWIFLRKNFLQPRRSKTITPLRSCRRSCRVDDFLYSAITHLVLDYKNKLYSLMIHKTTKYSLNFKFMQKPLKTLHDPEYKNIHITLKEIRYCFTA